MVFGCIATTVFLSSHDMSTSDDALITTVMILCCFPSHPHHTISPLSVYRPRVVFIKHSYHYYTTCLPLIYKYVTNNNDWGKVSCLSYAVITGKFRIASYHGILLFPDVHVPNTRAPFFYICMYPYNYKYMVSVLDMFY